MSILFRQCSECDNSNSNSEPETVDPNAPRKLRYGGRERSTSGSPRSSSITNDVCIVLIIIDNAIYFKFN